MIILKIILIYGALTGVLWLLSLFLYNYLYTEPATGMSWKIPLAGGIVVLVCLVLPLGLGHWTGSELPITLGHIFMRTRPSAVLEFDRIIINEGGRQVVYRREGTGLGPQKFISTDTTRRRFPREVNELIAVTRDNQQIKFQALRDEKGLIVQETGGAIYVSELGYRMVAVELGQVEISRPGTAFLVFMTVTLGLASWIGAFVLAQFNIGHAIGLGIGFYITWLFMMGLIF